MTQEIRSYARTSTYRVLTPEQERAVHEHALAVLDRVGVSTTNDRLLKVMADHGQRVDFEAKRIRFDPAFVEERRALAPSAYTLHARNPAYDLPLGGERGWLSTDGCPAHVLDLDTGQRRYSTKHDIAEHTKVADAMPQIAIQWQPCSANDEPVPVRPMHETHAQWPVTSKHIMQMTAIDPFNARGLVEMARAVAGGADALRERPLLSNFQCSISPLHWDDPTVEALEVFAEAGVPVGICSMPLAGASAPLSVAGLMTIANAEILSGFAILETLVPGAKTFHVSYNTTIDMNTGELNPAHGANDLFAEMACSQMGAYFGVPTCHGAYGVGSKTSDWQSGVQAAFGAFGAMLVPGDMLTGIGSVYGDSVSSMTELLLSAEVYDIAARFAEGYAFDEEAFALDTIESVGPTGHFLGEEHTLTHMREFWRDTFMDRRSWDDWEAQGRPDPRVAATAKAKDLLATHEPDPLPEDVEAELDRIMDAYEREALEREG
ncbi:MAG: trimethylamine methyltransferase family protein [Planctomycetaceae bacterium]